MAAQSNVQATLQECSNESMDSPAHDKPQNKHSDIDSYMRVVFHSWSVINCVTTRVRWSEVSVSKQRWDKLFKQQIVQFFPENDIKFLDFWKNKS